MNNVLTLSKSQIKLLEDLLISNNMTKSEVSSGSAYRFDGVVITVYDSGKILFQGKEADRWFNKVSASFLISSQDQPENNNGPIINKVLDEIPLVWPRIGTDESGKGDFFGPLVTAAFLVQSREIENLLLDLGVTDSKKLSDTKIKDIESKIKKLGPFEIIKISPVKYNELHSKMKNVNKILAWSHARAIENLLTKNNCNVVVADQFGDARLIEDSLFKLGKKVTLVQQHKAERDTAVAAASILARAAFIDSIAELSKKLGERLPLGAGKTVIDTGRKLSQNIGVNQLNEVAKIHFKTFEEIKK